MLKKFLFSAALLLLVTGAIKVVSSGQEVKFLTAQHVLFKALTNRQVLLVTAVVEIAVGLILLSRSTPELKLGVISTLATVFLSYRCSLWLVGYKGPCLCLGGAVNWLGINPRFADWSLNLMLGYLVLGSYWFLCLNLRRHRQGVKLQRLSPAPSGK